MSTYEAFKAPSPGVGRRSNRCSSTRGPWPASATFTQTRFCFDARLRPDRPGGSLKRVELRRLTASVHSILQAAVVGRGSSLADEQYRDLNGELGRFQLEHKVYGRLGQPCLRCGREVQRARFGAKSAYFCSSCQR